MWWTRHYSLTIYYYWAGAFHQGMWWTRHYLSIIYYYWARPIPLRNVSSPVGWDTVPSGSNRFFKGMFQSVTSDFHHWLTHKWKWQKPKWCQQVSNHQKPGKRKKKVLAQHTRTRLGLFCDGVKYYYSLIVVVYFTVQWGITIWCRSQGTVWAWTRRTEEKWTWVRHLETSIKLTFSTPYPQFMLHVCHCLPSSSQFPLLLQCWSHATTAIVLHCAAHYNMNPSHFVVIGISSALSWRYPKAQQPNKNWFITNWKGSTFSLQKTSYARLELQKGYRLGNQQDLLGYQM